MSSPSQDETPRFCSICGNCGRKYGDHHGRTLACPKPGPPRSCRGYKDNSTFEISLIHEAAKAKQP